MFNPRTALFTLKALGEASKRLQVSYTFLLKRFYYLYATRKFSPIEIFFNDLLNPRIDGRDLQFYMAKEELFIFQRKYLLPSYLSSLDDKMIFCSVCFATGIPAPKLMAVFDRPAGWTPEGKYLASQEDWQKFLQSLSGEFVVKPALGLQGIGVAAFRRDEQEFIDHDGHRWTGAELYTFLCRMKEHNLLGGSYANHSLRLSQESHKTLIQERVFAHPEIAELTGSTSLCTIRLYTLLDERADAKVLSSAFRIISGDHVTDSFHKGLHGNLWCSVDLETGRITEAFGKIPGVDRLEMVSRHPITKHEVLGFQIPYWTEAVALAKRLAFVFQPQPLVMWDIGVTPDGPVIIEGNVGAESLPTPLNRSVPALLRASPAS